MKFEVGRDKDLLEVLKNVIVKSLGIVSFTKNTTIVGDSTELNSRWESIYRKSNRNGVTC